MIRFYFRYVVVNAIRRRADKFVMWLAWHAVPRPLRVWVVVRAFADATTEPPYSTPDETGYSAVMRAMR
jgi:hypothetical protein